MATAWRRSTLCFREPWPPHHPQHYRSCYYLRLVLLISLAILLMEVAGVEGRVSSKGCLDRERDALLLYKAAIKDPSGRLSSWRAQVDCCAWTGVVCHNTTGSVRVAELNLENPNAYQDDNWWETALRGELLHPSLLSLTHLRNLSLSCNDFEGTQIPPLVGSLHKLRYLDLSDSNFSGTIPPHLGNLTNLRYLVLYAYHYRYSATIFHSLDWLSRLSSLIYLDMSALDLSAVSHNWLSAVNMLPSLQQLYLYDCKISNIPLSLNFHLNLTSLATLHLGRNNFNSSFPNWLWNLTSLSSLQLYYSNIRGMLPNEIVNKFSGNIPLWIGQSWQRLRILRLSSNMLNGNIDSQLGYLRDLQIIDFANNKLSGTIPHSFGNFSTMISTSVELLPSFNVPIEILEATNIYSGSESITLVTKGDQLMFSSILYLVKSIDLSNNELTYEIPEELGYLVGLHTLNLSRNYFKGKIPDSIGKMSSLETLDLSFNNLSGIIPQSLSQLNALSHLNLSYNNLSGSIPYGNQLQTLDDASIYIGNPFLCGDLVNKSCFHGNHTNAKSEENVILSPMLSIYLSSTLGYLVGLWSVFVLLLFKKRWRYSYFQKVDEIYDKVYVAIKIRLNRAVNE
ncbi:receptor-like protein EIX1 [Zingiber officinale]|uniref:receptor-like protein EIX1 n=1 Tax=Zingiber officinale TaxID=94328 RepID=UPI001C4CC706|nr:receptor-like protein EIX1 [Zingiber officinale]